VNVTYGILRRRGEFLAYHDERCNLTFSGDKGEIDLLESKIGRLITVTLEAIRTATSLRWRYCCQDQPGGQETSFVTLAIRTNTLAASVVRQFGNQLLGSLYWT
jgi:hypothetical protein